MKKLARYGICGNLGGGSLASDGQTIKTRVVTRALKELCGEEQVKTVDTFGGLKRFPKTVAGCVKLIASCENIIVITSRNGVRLFIPLFLFLRAFWRRKLEYILIGGWLPELLDKKPGLLRKLKKYDLICPETELVRELLEERGLSNVKVIPNCRFSPGEGAEAGSGPEFAEPLPLLSFSRINAGKGVKEMIEAVALANRRLGRCAFRLDIYGKADPEYEGEFEQLLVKYGDCVEYKGVSEAEKAPQIMCGYFAMIFLTSFGEGLPGTVIEAFSAGLPMITTPWDSVHEIMEERRCGKIVSRENCVEDTAEALCRAAEDPGEWLAMRQACRAEFVKYDALKVMKEFDGLN